MDRFWIVVWEKERRINRYGLSSDTDEWGQPPGVYHISDGKTFDTEADAKAHAAQKAGINNSVYFVAEIVGFQQPTYDPEIGWNPTEAK